MSNRFEIDRNSHFLKLKGIDTLDRADALAGLEIFIPEEGFRPSGRRQLLPLPDHRERGS